MAGDNGQAVVAAGQVIVGAMLSQHPVDRTLLHPLLERCRDQLAAAGIRPTLRTVLADAGYVSGENFARADTGKLRLFAPLAKDPGRIRWNAANPRKCKNLCTPEVTSSIHGRVNASSVKTKDSYGLPVVWCSPISQVRLADR